MTFEAPEHASAADAFLETAPQVVLADWAKRRAKLAHRVSMPSGLELPLRPLFVERRWVDQLSSASGCCTSPSSR